MTARKSRSTGYILLEVLVTIVIMVIGLLGLAGLQLRTSVAETEAYQRAQALVLVQDMVDRMYANRTATAAAAYVGADIGLSIVNCAGKTGSDLDLCQWGNALFGASETAAGGASIGTLLGGRGCITGAGQEYFVNVVWQGLVPTVAPAAGSPADACGKNQYSTDTLRRAVTMRVVISTLSAGTL